jgi:hypothetical protein
MNMETSAAADIKADDLKLVTFDDFDFIHGFLKKYPSEICDFNICNLLSWGSFYKLKYTTYLGRLILFNSYNSYLLSPVGEKLPAQELLKIENDFRKIDPKVEILAVGEDYVSDATVREYFSIQNDEDSNNYIYETADLVNLTGKKLAKKKNLISQFNRLYDDHYLKPITANDYEEIMNFCYYWRETHDTGSDYLDIEFEAIKTILTNWHTFPCDGLKLYVNGKICAFSVYSPQTQDMAAVHFEKYDPEIKGAGQVINQETAKILIDNYKYINREEDMGFAGIRQAKRSYQPVRMLPYYKLTLL